MDKGGKKAKGNFENNVSLQEFKRLGGKTYTAIFSVVIFCRNQRQ